MHTLTEQARYVLARCEAAIAHWDQWYGERLWGEALHCATKARLVGTNLDPHPRPNANSPER